MWSKKIKNFRQNFKKFYRHKMIKLENDRTTKKS